MKIRHPVRMKEVMFAREQRGREAAARASEWGAVPQSVPS